MNVVGFPFLTFEVGEPIELAERVGSVWWFASLPADASAVVVLHHERRPSGRATWQAAIATDYEMAREHNPFRHWNTPLEDSPQRALMSLVEYLERQIKNAAKYRAALLPGGSE